MGDLTEAQSSQSMKIVGAGPGTTPAETNFADVDGFGRLNTISTLAAGPQLSTFGQLRVAEPYTLFDAKFRYGKRPELFSESTSSGGTVTHDANRISIALNSGATNGATAVFQSLRRLPYQSGKTSRCFLSMNVGAGVSNKRKRWGLFDQFNGVFFELNGTALSVVTRSSVSGSVVDTSVAQSSWNGDKLDGTGLSGATLDLSAQNLFVIDFSWLGIGIVRFCVEVNGVLTVLHTVRSANVITSPYSQTGTLPVRIEITNTGASSSQNTYFTCASVQVDGGCDPTGTIAYASRGVASGKSVNPGNTIIPIVSVRKQSSYLEIQSFLKRAEVFMSTADDGEMLIVKNGTLTGAAWGDNVGNFSEMDLSATAITGGTYIGGSYVRGNNSSLSIVNFLPGQSDSLFWLGTDLAGASEIISLCMRTITGNSTVYGLMEFREAD